MPNRRFVRIRGVELGAGDEVDLVGPSDGIALMIRNSASMAIAAMIVAPGDGDRVEDGVTAALTALESRRRCWFGRHGGIFSDLTWARE